MLETYGVYRPVPRNQAKGKYVTTQWEEIAKCKQGRWVVRSRFVAGEFRWQRPHRDFFIRSHYNIIIAHRTPCGCWICCWPRTRTSCVYDADVECAFFHAPELEDCFVKALGLAAGKTALRETERPEDVRSLQPASSRTRWDSPLC